MESFTPRQLNSVKMKAKMEAAQQMHTVRVISFFQTKRTVFNRFQSFIFIGTI